MWGQRKESLLVVTPSLFILKNAKATGELQEQYNKYSYARRRSTFETY